MLQTKPGPPRRPTTPFGQSALVYCYNCAQKGHYGHVSLNDIGHKAFCCQGVIAEK